jgi:uncharacterized protein (TIGR00304 family)
MQTIWQTQILGWILLIVGVVIVVLSLFSALASDKQGESRQTKSRGLILIGPIPIVWGFGTRGWLVAGVIVVALVIIWLVTIT